MSSLLEWFLQGKQSPYPSLEQCHRGVTDQSYLRWCFRYYLEWGWESSFLLLHGWECSSPLDGRPSSLEGVGSQTEVHCHGCHPIGKGDCIVSDELDKKRIKSCNRCSRFARSHIKNWCPVVLVLFSFLSLYLMRSWGCYSSQRGKEKKDEKKETTRCQAGEDSTTEKVRVHRSLTLFLLHTGLISFAGAKGL